MKKHFKQILSLLCIAILVLSSASCANQPEEQTDTVAFAPVNKTINVNGIEYYGKDMVDFVVYSNYLEFQYYYGTYFELLGIDTEKELDKQYPSITASSQLGFDSSKNWLENFVDYAFADTKDLVGLSSKAKADGVLLNDDDRKQIEEFIQNYKNDAASSEMTLQAYLQSVYTENVTEDTLRRYAEDNLLAGKVVDEALGSYDVTQNGLDTYVSGHRSSYYDTVSFRFWTFSYETDNDDMKNQTNSLKDEIAACADRTEEGTKTVCDKYSASYGEVVNGTLNATNVADGINAYVIDNLTEEGSFCTFNDTAMKKSYVIELTKAPVLNDDGSVICNIRHILVEDEATAAKVIEEYNKGDKTEDSFGELAAEYSTDPGSKDNGGLYEDVATGQMVTEFNDWMFDSARKIGDIETVKTSYGYHVMLCVELPHSAFYASVKSDILQEGYNKLMTDVESDYQVTIQ